MDTSIILQRSRLHLKNLADMLPLFQTLHNKGKKRPKIHYINSKEGILKVYDEMMDAKKAFFVASYPHMEQAFPGAVKRWFKIFTKKRFKINGTFIVSNSADEVRIAKSIKKINPDQRIKLCPGLEKMNMYFTVYDDKLALLFIDDGPFLVLIESEGIYDSMKPVLDMLWIGARGV